ncbi:MAG: hypothetical protein M3367_10860 [Acidobacteriota bacterium]|nr:hypothetical protein [Acidobacteriota bacterium]
MFREKFLEVDMKRNLFKFVALNSLKILCVISIFFLTCAMISAQSPKPVKRLGRSKPLPKPIEASKIIKGGINKLDCITNLKAEIIQINTTGSRELRLTFSTLEAITAEVNIQKWGAMRAEEKPDWLYASSNQGAIDENGKSIRNDHSFRIRLNYVDSMVAGNRYRVQLNGATYKGGVTQGGMPTSVPKSTFFCEKEFTAEPKPITKLGKAYLPPVISLGITSKGGLKIK